MIHHKSLVFDPRILYLLPTSSKLQQANLLACKWKKISDPSHFLTLGMELGQVKRDALDMKCKEAFTQDLQMGLISAGTFLNSF